MNPELYEMLHVLDTRITNLEQINKENQIKINNIGSQPMLFFHLLLLFV